MRQFLYFTLSFLIVASAQPDWSPLACIFAASFGYALFWKGLLLSDGIKKRFLFATLWFALIQAIQVSWFTADRYVGGYIFLLIPLLSLMIGGQFGFISLFVHTLSIYRILGISGGWALCEWARLYLLSGYSWNPSGLALSGTLYGMQLASVGGIFGMSFWIFFTNLLVLRVFNSFSWREGALWLVVLVTPYLFGWAEVVFHNQHMQKNSLSLSALAVQTAIYPEYKLSLNGSQPLSPLSQWERILMMLEPYKHNSYDLILFSESVVPYGLDTPLYPLEEVKRMFLALFGSKQLPDSALSKVGNAYWAQALADHFSAPVVMGLEAFDESEAYNAAFLFTPFSNERGRYEKRVLVPLAEYIPFAWVRPLCARYGIVDSYTPGKEAKVFHTDRAKIGVSICYEETYGDLMRESRLKGASLLVNLTNDVWYPRSRLPMVHFMHGRLRAVEAGIPLLRSCNTGVTCGVDSLGRVVAQLPYESARSHAPATALALSLPMYTITTFYTQFGDLPVILFSFCAFSLLSLSSLLKRKSFSINDLDVYPLRKN